MIAPGFETQPVGTIKRYRTRSLPLPVLPPCSSATSAAQSCYDYVELHARSAFSFLEGASVPEELIATGLGFDMPAMALLDRDGVYGAPRLHLSAKKNG